MNISEPTGTMPDYIFTRRRGIELEKGLALAGYLITRFQKTQKGRLRRDELAEITAVIKALADDARAARIADDAIAPDGPAGRNPPMQLIRPTATRSWIR